LHLALAIAPSVGIYWLTNLYEAGPLVQDKHRAALSARVNCARCGAENLANRCPHDASFVDDVALEEVIGMAMQPFLDRRWRQKLIPPVVRQAMHSLRRRAVRAHAAGLKAKHVVKPQRAKDNEFFYTEMLDRRDIACILCKGIRKCQGEYPDSDLSGVAVKQQEEFAVELMQLSCRHALANRVRIHRQAGM
jgi:hypothetical protein